MAQVAAVAVPGQLSLGQLRAAMLTAEQAGAAAAVAGVSTDTANPLSCARQRGGNWCKVSWQLVPSGAGPAAASAWSFPTTARAKTLLRDAANDTSIYFMHVVSANGSAVVTTVSGQEAGLDTDSASVYLRRGANVAGATCTRPASKAAMTTLIDCARKVARAQAAALQ